MSMPCSSFCARSKACVILVAGNIVAWCLRCTLFLCVVCILHSFLTASHSMPVPRQAYHCHHILTGTQCSEISRESTNDSPFPVGIPALKLVLTLRCCLHSCFMLVL